MNWYVIPLLSSLILFSLPFLTLKQLGHDIIKSLSGTPVEWLVHLLRVFNSGDITGYEALVRKYSQELSQQVVIAPFTVKISLSDSTVN